MAETPDSGDEATGIDDVNNSRESNNNNLARNNGITTTATCSDDNNKNDATATSDYGGEATDIDDANNSHSNSNDVPQTNSTTGTDTCSNDNSKNGRNTAISTNPKIGGEGVGRGYDANIPAVFKAKVSDLLRSFKARHGSDSHFAQGTRYCLRSSKRHGMRHTTKSRRTERFTPVLA